MLVLPAAGRDDAYTARFRAALDAVGYGSAGWGLGINLGPTRRLCEGAAARVRSLAAAHGPVSVVGFSMGGLFARWLAHTEKSSVRDVITVCSPFREPLDSAFLPLRPMQAIWPGADHLAEMVGATLPVPTTCLYTRQDGIVAWRSCLDPDAPDDCFEVDGPHVTVAQNPQVFAVVAGRLAGATILAKARCFA